MSEESLLTAEAAVQERLLRVGALDERIDISLGVALARELSTVALKMRQVQFKLVFVDAPKPTGRKGTAATVGQFTSRQEI